MGLLFIPQMIHEYGELRWNDIDRKTEELEEYLVPVPVCPSQIPHGLTQAQTQASAVRRQNCLSHGIAIFKMNDYY
jgi:hypothetical protein